MTMVIPVIVFLLIQRVFTRGRRHHRRREVSGASAGRSAGRADLRRGAPGPADRAGRHRARSSRSSQRRDVRATFFVQGRWAEADPEVGPRDRRRRAPRRQPLALPCADDAPDATRAWPPTSRDAADGDPRRDGRRSAAVVPLPVRGGRRRSAGPGRASRRPGYRHVGWDVAAEDWDPARDAPAIEGDLVARHARPRRRRRDPAARLAGQHARGGPRRGRPAARCGRPVRPDRRAGHGPDPPNWT